MAKSMENPVMESVRSQLSEFYNALELHEDGEEWEDSYGFRFRRVGKGVEVWVGGQFCEYLWWLSD